MPTPTWERLPEARRKSVIEAAEAEFGRKGFAGGSLNVIAREAGVSKGSLFQYFTDKADLFMVLAERSSQRIRETLAPVIMGAFHEDSFIEAFSNLVLEWVRYFRRRPEELALTGAVMLDLERADHTAVRRVVNRHYVEVLVPLLQRACDRFELPDDLDVEATAAVLICILHQLALAPHTPGIDPLLGLDGDDEDLVDAAVTRFVEPVLRGMVSPRRNLSAGQAGWAMQRNGQVQPTLGSSSDATTAVAITPDSGLGEGLERRDDKEPVGS